MAKFYAIDSVHTTVKEWSWGSKSPLVILIALILRTLRVRIPSSSDDANVDSTLEFLVESIPADVEEKFRLLADSLVKMGFCDPIYHEIEDHGTQTRIVWATYRHVSGQYCARLHNRQWAGAQKRDRGTFPLFISAFTDGTFLVSSAGKPDVLAPDAIEMNRMKNAPIDELWQKHLAILSTQNTGKTVQPITNRDELVDACERLHVLQRDFHLDRGFFRVRTAAEDAKAGDFAIRVGEQRISGVENPEAMAELTRLQEAKPRWTSGIWVLLGSALLFFAAGAAQWDWKFTLWLIPILLFHEFGHWIAMRIFRYRNLRMFFIPFFGAAVSGQHWNVPGWKKALVSLAGPVPGIILGVVLAWIGVFSGSDWMKKAALMLVIINGYNLVPVLPLDGGHFLHTTIFCRNRWTDIGFRALAVVGLMLLSIFGGMVAMRYLAIAFAVGLPIAFKMGKVVEEYRKKPLPPPLPGEDKIPAETARTLIASVSRELVGKGNSKVIAQQTLEVYETLNARPPGIWATFALLGLYATAWAAAVICAIVLVISRESGLSEFFRAAALQPKHSVECAECEIWKGGGAEASTNQSFNLVVSNLKNRKLAKGEFDRLKGMVPPNSGLIWFGESVLLRLPTSDDEARKHWYDEMHRSDKDAFVVLSNNATAVSLSFIAPTATNAAEIARQFEEYFALSEFNVIPPWDPRASGPRSASWKEARQVWAEISKESSNEWKDKSVMEYAGKIKAADRRGDRSEVEKLQEGRRQLIKEIGAETRKRLETKYGASSSGPLVQLHYQLAQTAYTNRVERVEVCRKIGQLLGSDDLNAAGFNRAGFGFVSRHSLIVQMPYGNIPDPMKNLPMLLNWICGNHCVSVKYEFSPIGNPGSDRDLDDSQ